MILEYPAGYSKQTNKQTNRRTRKSYPGRPTVGVGNKPSAYETSLFFPFPLRSSLLNPARQSGERCKLPQWGLGRSLSRQRF